MKRLISLTVSVLMILAMLPLAVSAQNTVSKAEYQDYKSFEWGDSLWTEKFGAANSKFTYDTVTQKYEYNGDTANFQFQESGNNKRRIFVSAKAGTTVSVEKAGENGAYVFVNTLGVKTKPIPSVTTYFPSANDYVGNVGPKATKGDYAYSPIKITFKANLEENLMDDSKQYKKYPQAIRVGAVVGNISGAKTCTMLEINPDGFDRFWTWKYKEDHSTQKEQVSQGSGTQIVERTSGWHTYEITIYPPEKVEGEATYMYPFDVSVDNEIMVEKAFFSHKDVLKTADPLNVIGITFTFVGSTTNYEGATPSKAMIGDITSKILVGPNQQSSLLTQDGAAYTNPVPNRNTNSVDMAVSSIGDSADSARFLVKTYASNIPETTATKAQLIIAKYDTSGKIVGADVKDASTDLIESGKINLTDKRKELETEVTITKDVKTIKTFLWVDGLKPIVGNIDVR